MIIPEPASCSRPVLFTEVQKKPVGLKLNRSPSAEKLEIIEKLLEPHSEAVIDEFVVLPSYFLFWCKILAPLRS
jgi:hypothetical protein